MSTTEILYPRFDASRWFTAQWSLPNTGMLSLGDVFCFLLPALQVVRFDLVGEMCAADGVILAAVPVAIARHPERLREKPILLFLGLGTCWLLGQIFTDMIRGSAPQDYLRGWSKIALLLANVLIVWLVACRSQRRFLLYGTGLGIGAILGFYAHPSGDALLSPWKFAIGAPTTMLMMMWAPQLAPNRYVGILLPALAIAVVHAFADVRSLAMISVITAIYALFQMSLARAQTHYRLSRLLLLAVVIVCGVWVFTRVYAHYAEQGLFGDYAQHKLEAQTSGSGGLLLGGRGEILASSQAIIDSPWLGHGSWARDPIYAAILAQKRADLGYKEMGGRRIPHDGLIPTHSYIFGAWVEAGIAGAVFWLFILGYTIRTLFKVSGAEPLLPVFAFGGFLLIWDIFFSPLGMPTRFIAPFFMAAMFALSSLRAARREI